MRYSDICRRRQVVIRALFGGDRTVDAWTHQDWAAHQQPDLPQRFSITHLPTALCLPLEWASFRTIAGAVGAMVAIARLRNDWSRVTQADFTRDVGGLLAAICRRYGAVEGPATISVDADISFLGTTEPRRNGYESPDRRA